MKTVILCGGTGTRLVGETEFKPKPLVEIGGKPILWHIMKIYESQGFNDFILCLGYKGNMIKNYILNLKEMSNDFQTDLKTGDTLVYPSNNNESSLEGKVLCVDTGLKNMTGSRIAKIKKYIGDDEDFFLTYGDGVANVDLNNLYQFHKQKGKIVTITSVQPSYKFGVFQFAKDGYSVKNFDEKPKIIYKVNGGFMVCNKKIFNYLNPNNDDSILERGPFKKLASEKQMVARFHRDYWHCMDTQKDVDELNVDYANGAPWFNLSN